MPVLPFPCEHPPLPHHPGLNWVEKQGGLPRPIDCVARAIYWEGHSGGDVQTAVKYAIGRMKFWAGGGGGVKPKTQAAAAAAVARWEAMKAAEDAKGAAKKAG